MVAAAPGTPPWVHPATSYPGPVRAEIARRREQILTRSQGRVLDLDDPATADRFAGIGPTRIGGAATPGHEPLGTYDTVVATGVLAGFADLGAITVALAACVAPDGVLLFVEPVGRPGWSNLLRTTVAGRPGRRRWADLHLDRDVPAAVRAAGLVVCDLDRGVLSDQPPSLRHWVSGRAVRIDTASSAGVVSAQATGHDGRRAPARVGDGRDR